MPGGIHPPPSVIASWPKPNYITPDTRGPGVAVVAGIFGALAFATVSARLWARAIVQRNVGIDDYLMVVA
ncbi:hypothetical protein AOQ84DRAFT_264547, partial [Glonium stellatum]